MYGLRKRLASMTPREQRHVRPLCSAALALAAFFALGSASSIAADRVMHASDWKAIKQVITAQRTALIAGNGEKAFGYATPALRVQFGDADTFLAMVHVGYSALLTARYTEFLQGAIIDGLVIQPLRLVDVDNSVRVALYTLERQPGGAWRISGCRIGPSTVHAAQSRDGRSRGDPHHARPAMRSTASSKRLA